MVSSALDARAQSAGDEIIPVPLQMRFAWYPLIWSASAQTYAVVPARNIYARDPKAPQPILAGGETKLFERDTAGPLGIPYMRDARADYDDKGNSLLYRRNVLLVWGILWTDTVERVGPAGADLARSSHRAGILWSMFGYGHRGDRRVTYLLGFPIPIGRISAK